MADRHPSRPGPDDAPQSPETTTRAKAPGSPEGQTAPLIDVQPAEAEEMGGESPCQLHRFWDVDE